MKPAINFMFVYFIYQPTLYLILFKICEYNLTAYINGCKRNTILHK